MSEQKPPPAAVQLDEEDAEAPQIVLEAELQFSAVPAASSQLPVADEVRFAETVKPAHHKQTMCVQCGMFHQAAIRVCLTAYTAFCVCLLFCQAVFSNVSVYMLIDIGFQMC